MTLRNTLGAGTAIAAALVVGLGAPAHAASTIVVYETTASTQGWVESPPVADGTIDWTSAGLELSTPFGTSKVQLGSELNLPLAALTALSYEAEILEPGSVATQIAALNLVIDFNGDATGGFATLVYEPIYNGESLDAVRGGDAIWWSTRVMPGVPMAFDSYVPLSEIVAANPDAVAKGIIINQGTGNPGLVTLVESITINDEIVTFRDGAPPVALLGKAECKDGGWMSSTAPVFLNQGDCVSYFSSGK